MLPTILRHRGRGPDPEQRAGDVPDAGQGGGTRRRWVIHPFLIAVFPILALYSHNVYETLPRSLAAPIAVALAGALATWLLLRWLSGDSQRAALAASLLVAAFFGFNPCRIAINMALDNLSLLWVRDSYDVHSMTVLLFQAPIVGAGLFAIFRLVKNADAWTTFLNTFALILTALPAASVVQARFNEPKHPIVRPSGGIPTTARPEPLPHIFHIILDAYARSDEMNELFGFDNEPFLKRLEQKGFFVARRSTANYCQTPLSLSSTLNCDYLDKLVSPGNHDFAPLSTLICDNLVVKSLRPLGYRFAAFATGYEQTECFEADSYLAPRHPNDNFHLMLLSMTPLRFVPFHSQTWDYFTSVRDRVLFTLDQLPEIAARTEPTFTFAHITSPHHPFVFGENGEDISPRVASQRLRFGESDTPAEYQKNYRRQAIYLTKRIEQTIDRILANCAVPPIIILQSDHGSGLRHHLDDLEKTDLHERLSILNCYYFPGRKYDALSDDITPVNSFRVVLNTYFGAGLPLLENINYFSTYEHSFNFIDVTERLRSGRDRGRTYTPPARYDGMLH